MDNQTPETELAWLRGRLSEPVEMYEFEAVLDASNADDVKQYLMFLLSAASRFGIEQIRDVLRRLDLLSMCNDQLVAGAATWLLEADQAELSRFGDKQRRKIEQLKTNVRVAEAIVIFLKSGGYENIDVAAIDLELTHQQVWDKILADAELPLSKMPPSIQIR